MRQAVGKKASEDKIRPVPKDMFIIMWQHSYFISEIKRSWSYNIIWGSKRLVLVWFGFFLEIKHNRLIILSKLGCFRKSREKLWVVTLDKDHKHSGWTVTHPAASFTKMTATYACFPFISLPKGKKTVFLFHRELSSLWRRKKKKNQRCQKSK